jgi:DNA-binding NtrC family response regulator
MAGDGAHERESGTWIAKAERGESLHVRKCRLEVVSGPDAGLKRVVGASTILIGRAGTDLVLGDRKVSALHAEIRLEDGGYRLRDLGSTNGTWVQGLRIVETFLPPGAVIGVGDSSVRFVPLAESVELPLWEQPRFGALVGRSAVMRRLFERIERIAQSESTVLVTGETGTGKELVAEAIHERSPRAGRPFVVLDCGAVPPQLFEDQLFGHEPGAFTGATRAAPGVFEAAAGGTLFIDELGELPLDVQPKLLRAVETRRVRRLGAVDTIDCDVRVIAATNRDLAVEINRGTFRADLYYRVAVARLTLPPLRERLEDLEPLVEHFLAELPPGAALPPGWLDEARRHPWPGNVRELRNAVERAVMLRPYGQEADDVAPRAAAGPTAFAVDTSIPFKQAKQRLVDEFDRRYMSALLAEHDGNISAVARAAGVDRMSVYKLLARLGIRHSKER